jgi:multidrug efflux pump subunit AcrB
MRDNQMRVIEISASLDKGATISEVSKRINKVIDEFDVPRGYNIYDAGLSRTLQQGKQTTLTLLGLALFLVFVVMAVQYESLRNPVIIMLSVPFAAIGVAIGINLLDMPLSTPVWLGMIMLAGIVVNNAIVLIDSVNRARADGIEKRTAILESAETRLRPILITTLTTVLGLTPMALGLGEGAEIRAPMAITVIGGLIVSTVLTLVIIPVVYDLLDRKRYDVSEPAPTGELQGVRP